jgi:hypothetical protein
VKFKNKFNPRDKKEGSQNFLAIEERTNNNV